MPVTLLTELTARRGVSGDEGDIRAFLKEQALLYTSDVSTDTMGNLFAVQDGGDADAPHIMLAAHMDEIGFLITHIDEDGLLHYAPVGGVDPRVVVSKRVQVGPDRVPGIIGAKAIHLQSAEDMDRVLDHDHLTIDIGASNKKEAEGKCPPGSYATFDSPLAPFGRRLVRSKALDDRVGCLALLRALKDAKYPGRLTCVFTVQEEVGLRGATVAAYRVQPDIAFALEGTTCNDLGKVPAHLQVTRVGGGPVLTFMDRAAIAHPKILSAVLDEAAAQGIPTQFKQAVAGGTDTGAIQRSRGGVAAMAMAVPCRYIHSGGSVCSLDDIENEQKLLLAVLERFAKQNPLA